MKKTAFFKKILRGKFLLKELDQRELTMDEKKELNLILSYFGHERFTDKEWKYISEKYSVQKTKLDLVLDSIYN